MEPIPRKYDESEIKALIQQFPVTAILGPRQCGKTTLARHIGGDHYFDLENPRDLARLDQPQLALEDLQGLIVIDEIQRIPELFPLLRYLVDTHSKQKYLILGSASRDMIRQSYESLAGRIGYHGLGGFRVTDNTDSAISRLWLRGGLPPSLLAMDENRSCVWRENYITTFLERDIPQLGIRIAANTLRRFWTMLSHYHGQVMNYSELSRSFGISDMTARKYIDILQGTFMVRVLHPYHVNIGKRLVKRPKIYVADSGLFHTLLSIETLDQLTAHPKLGPSWEGFALDQVCRAVGRSDRAYYFWATHAGAELDLLWQARGKNWGVEVKYNDAPKLTKSMKTAVSDLALSHLWVIYPGKTAYRLAPQISVLPLTDICAPWSY